MGSTISQNRGPNLYLWIFPGAVLLVYLVLFFIEPEKAESALKYTGIILSNMLIPLIMVFTLMLILNLFLKPAQITKFLGKDSGVKGVVFSVAAGIISTGPIYAWYPLLKELKEKGAGNHIIAIFLYNRSVKPFLLPVMISYFGLIYVSVLILMTILGSITLGYTLNAMVKEQSG